MGNAGGGGNGLTRIMSEAMGGHHGRFAHPEDIKKARARLSGEPSEWGALRQKADALLRERLASGAEVTANTATNLSTAVMAMTGFTILCDWLGSDGAYFEPANETDLDEYAILSQEFAERAVRESGLGAGTLSGAPLDVGELFADLGGLRPLQTAINDVPDTLLQTATLTIIEAPTGEGKTEAALALAHRMARAGGTDEMYYALPTMATSNQMFGRLAKHMEVRLGLGAAIKLVHGQAHLIEEDLRAATEMNAPLGNGDDARQDAADDAVTWFNSKKRALIAPFGVGTVDQAELAALNVKHATLRMMGLVGKVVIIDEVHAYDTYMTTIIERLLRWLAAMHTSVILLSATLPAARRRKLAEAFGAEMELPETALTAYPNLLVLGRDGYHHASPAAWQAGRTLTLGDLHLGDDDAAQKAAWLASAVADGGCACWITNTVRRAQNIFRNLQKIAPVGTQLQLLHSQFPLDARLAREQALEKAYGRPGEEVERPVRGIVVGTQVLEQSLDLDFDVMVSDLAPVDLLLQRAGRLHRHERQRPAAHATPRLWVNWERNADGGLRMGSDRTIYDEYIMRVTHRTLGGRTVIRLPADYRTLIEAVYADREPAADDPLRDAWDNLKRKEQYAQQEARQRLLPEPLARDSFARMSAVSVAFEEDENRADWIVAQTRLGEETLNVIPLERDKDDAILPGGMRVPIGRAATLETQRRLLKRQLRVSQREAIGAIRADAQAAPCGLFSDSNLLKGFLPLWLTQGQARLVTERGPLVLALDVALGLIITKEASNA